MNHFLLRQQHSPLTCRLPLARLEDFAADVVGLAAHRQVLALHLHNEHGNRVSTIFYSLIVFNGPKFYFFLKFWQVLKNHLAKRK